VRTPLSLLMWALAEWSLLTGLQTMAVGVGPKMALTKLELIGACSSPVLLLIVALGCAGLQRHLTIRNQLLLWLVPAATLCVGAINPWGLIWRSAGLAPGTSILIYEHGIGFWVATAYLYAVMAVSLWLLATTLVSHARLQRRQAAAILIGATLPWAANLCYVANLVPWRGVDPTPVAFVFSCAAFVFDLYGCRLLDLVPLARDTLVEKLADGILVLDAEHRVLDLNQAACDLAGLDQLVIGRPVASALATQAELAAFCLEQDEGQREVSLGGSSARWLGLRGMVLRDRRNRPVGRLVMMQDITLRKQSEEDLKAANRELGQRLIELENRNQELDAFGHTVAHDLLNPLSNVLGLSELLLSSELSPDEVQWALSAIQNGGQKMKRIVEELLCLAQVRSLEVERQPMAMGPILEAALDALAPQFEQSHAELLMPATEDWPQVLGHAAWLEQVWVNYLSNALKYGGRPPYIEVGAERRSGMAVFWVRDNGLGLSPEEQARLFTPFERAGQHHAAGYGLGLSIVQRIVEKLSGHVGLESTPGTGSTFSFALPMPVTRE